MQLFPPKWWYRKLTDGLRGTYIASTCYPGEHNTVYHVYSQDEGNCLQDIIYEQQESKNSGEINTIPLMAFLRSDSNAIIADLADADIDWPAYTPLTAVSWFIDDSYLRLYYLSEDGHVLKLSRDEGEDWKGPVDLPSSRDIEKNSQIAAFEQDDGWLIRIYHTLSNEKLGENFFL